MIYVWPSFYRDRSISEKLTFDHLHPSERVAALRIDLPDIEYEISQVQLGRRKQHTVSAFKA